MQLKWITETLLGWSVNHSEVGTKAYFYIGRNPAAQE